MKDRDLKEKSIAFINEICASDILESEIKVQRTYAVCMYMINVLGILTVEEAEEIMDRVKGEDINE